MPALDQSEIERKLSTVSGWTRSGDSIERSFERGDFEGSVTFLNAVTDAAQELDHHPDVAISWSKITFTLSTHSAGGLTDADFELATRIDELA